jgi:hypothetical protein
MLNFVLSNTNSLSNQFQNIQGGDGIRQFVMSSDVEQKLTEDWGKRLAKEIVGTVYGTNSYMFSRNSRFRVNRNMANGRLDVKSMFQDKMNFDGKQNFANLNWKAPAIVNTIISGIVGRWMGRGEKIQVQAVDLKSKTERTDKEVEAEFYFENKDDLQEMQQASGVELIPKDQFVAEDADELDEWKTEFNRLPEEIGYELAVNNIFDANGLFSVIKEKLLRDSAEVGFLCTYTYMDENGEVHTDWLQPENCFTSYSRFPDFRDTTWRGHIKTLKVSELRSLYSDQFGGKIDEETIFKIAQTSKNYQYYDKLTWLPYWNLAYIRPYDEWNVDVMCWEFRSLDTDRYTFTKTKNNNSTLIDKGTPKKLKDNQKVVEDKKWNIYKGVYHRETDTLLEWGIKENMIRPQDPKELGNAEFSYSFYMYDQYDMRNIALPEKIEECIEGLILTRLKIQQLVARMKPAGAAINVDALNELDLGLAEATTPLEIQRLWEQTGNLYYRGKDAEGNPLSMPINELPNSGFQGQLQALIGNYQFYMQDLQNQLGEDPNLASAASKPRVAEGNVQTALMVSDAKTDYMYDAYLYVMEETAKKVACLLNTSVTYGAKKYRDLLKQEDVKGRDFSTEIKMLPNENDIARLEAQMNAAIASNPTFAVYLDTFKVVRLAKENVKLAEQYYQRCMKRMIKTEAQKSADLQRQNAEVQVQSAQAKAQSDAQLLQQKIELESQIEELRAKNKEREIILTGIFGLYAKGLQVPSELKQVEMGVIQNIVTPLIAENMQQQAQIAQGMAEQQQAIGQPVPQEQQNPQEEMMEQQQGTQESPMQEQQEYQQPQ